MNETTANQANFSKIMIRLMNDNDDGTSTLRGEDFVDFGESR
jgi:hypothetical protein